MFTPPLFEVRGRVTRPTRHNRLKHAAVRLVAQDETSPVVLSGRRKFETVWRAKSSLIRPPLIASGAFVLLLDLLFVLPCKNQDAGFHVWLREQQKAVDGNDPTVHDANVLLADSMR